MKKKGMTLAFKMNILIALIMLTACIVLVKICNYAYTQTVYKPFLNRLEKCEKLFEEGEYDDRLMGLHELTKLDGFDKAHDGTDTENQMINFEAFLYKYRFTKDGKLELAPDENSKEYQDYMEGKGDMINYATSEYYNVIYDIREIAVNNDLSSVEVYIDDGSKLIQIGRGDNDPDAERIVDILQFGKVFDNVEAIDTYTSQKKHEPFMITSRTKADYVRVHYKKIDGLKLYVVYYTDVTEQVLGQKTFLVESLIFVILMIIVAMILTVLLLHRIATKPLTKLAEAASAFAPDENGEYNEDNILKLDYIKSKDEIGALGREINSMQTRIVEGTKNLTRMTSEREKIKTELDMAASIQLSALPSVFPAFPDRKEFDIYASMTPAKEVGGDFYDFFLVDDNHLCLVMADVSGKGVPAALFMMASKIIIEHNAMKGLSPAQILQITNDAICRKNPEDMFVSVWLGILEISTGRLVASNAGHEYPVITNEKNEYELMKDKHGFVIGGMEGSKYTDYELTLWPGDKLFIYTDGVPEATDAQEELFGNERMIETLNKEKDAPPKKLLENVSAAVNEFVKDAEQFDDLTMLCLEYKGNGKNV